jgi:hypothetical protein
MVEVRLLHSQPFMKSTFHFLIALACAKFEKMLQYAEAVLLNNSNTLVEEMSYI